MMSQYEMLFGDQGLDEVLTEIKFPPSSKLEVARARVWEGRAEQAEAAAQGGDEPWASFIIALGRMNANQDAQGTLLKIAGDPQAEPRVRLWAFTALRKGGYEPTPKDTSGALGVVVEVPMPFGLDVLAAYADGSVRFLGAAGQLVVMEGSGKPPPVVAEVIAAGDSLLAVPPAPRARPSKPPAKDMLRLSALTAKGVHSVEVPWAEIEKGGRYEQLFVAASKLLAQVTQSGPKS